MEWSGQKDFASSAEASFLVDNVQAGVLKSHGALSFLKVVIKHFFHFIVIANCSKNNSKEVAPYILQTMKQPG
jgi:hypothetical protein